MLIRALFVLSGLFFVRAVKSDIYGDLSLFHELQQEPYRVNWDWGNPLVNNRRAVEDDISLEDDDSDREPLGKNYRDPPAASSEQKPVVVSKPESDVKTESDKSDDTQKPISPFQGFLPDGIVDVKAGGFGGPLNPFNPDFDFSSTFGINSKPFGFGDLFNSFQSNQWWKGKNVCIEREESTDDDDDESDEDENNDEAQKNSTTKAPKSLPDLFSTSISLSNCYETANKYECITKINNHGVFKTFTVRYKCCYGYTRKNGGSCDQKTDLKPILDTLTDIKTNEFKNLIATSNLEEKFTDGNFSIFVPTDAAISEYNEKITEMNNVRRRRGIGQHLSTGDLVLSHTVSGFVDLSDLPNDKIILSENSNSTIRINIYPTNTREKLLTANCARVKTPNVLASNGILHVTEGVVLPATQNVETIINTHPRLTNFKQAISNSDIPSHMKPTGHYTVFAPTDEAFSKLDEVQKQKILSGAGCASSILKYHFTSHTVCSPAIIGNATTHNVEGDLLNLERTIDDELIFEKKSKIIDTDIMATNGVIHLIDTIIIPDSGLHVGNVLKHQNYSKFQELIEKAELQEQINGLQNATVFVPNNQAFESPEGQKLLSKIENDKEAMQEIVRYHAIQGQLQSADMNNNEKLVTFDNGKELRLNLYSTLPLLNRIVNRATVNCARLIGFDEKACGSTIHEVNKILVPPSQNLLEVIESDPKYSTFRTLLNDTQLEKTLRENNQSLTLLAPTDESFAALEDKDRETLMKDKNKAEYLLKHHVLTEVLCCSGVGPHSWGFSSFVSTLANTQVEVGRSGSRIRINRAVVTGCDNLATNGVVHTINKVLLPRQPQVSSIGGFFLFDL
ncbi:transforming growth factor-beta-induced protein ig-h3 [Diorhabda sublineata]|uniref:transforming growth factor-beta-induced protein ig-h3 n=1 Tax=Diorhabda sublineata TaxID=1163346 RepID=UPI0024E096D5|nr:transforming growth factor-beta-induced protein ig-h3 [Diorhabda sublineata]